MRSRVYLLVILLTAPISLSALQNSEPTLSSASIPTLDTRYQALYKEMLKPQGALELPASRTQDIIEAFLSSPDIPYKEQEIIFNSLLKEESSQSKLLLNFLLDCLSVEFVPFKAGNNPLIKFFIQYTKVNSNNERSSFKELLEDRPGLQNLLMLEKPERLEILNDQSKKGTSEYKTALKIYKQAVEIYKEKFPTLLQNFFMQELKKDPASPLVQHWIALYIENPTQSPFKEFFTKLLTSSNTNRFAVYEQILKYKPELLQDFFMQEFKKNPTSPLVQHWTDLYIENPTQSPFNELFIQLLTSSDPYMNNARVRVNNQILIHIYAQFNQPYADFMRSILRDKKNPVEFLTSSKLLAIICSSNSSQSDKQEAFEKLSQRDLQILSKLCIKETVFRGYLSKESSLSDLKKYKPEDVSYLQTFMEQTTDAQRDSIMLSLANELPTIINDPLLSSELEPVITMLKNNNFAKKYPGLFKSLAQAWFDNLVNQPDLPPAAHEKKIRAMETTLLEVVGTKGSKIGSRLRIWIREYCSVSKIMIRIPYLRKNDEQRYEACQDLAELLVNSSELSAKTVCNKIGTILQSLTKSADHTQQINILIEMLRKVPGITPDIITDTITRRLSGSLRRSFLIATLDWKSAPSVSLAETPTPPGTDLPPITSDPSTIISTSSTTQTTHKKSIVTTSPSSTTGSEQQKKEQIQREQEQKREHQEEEQSIENTLKANPIAVEEEGGER